MKKLCEQMLKDLSQKYRYENSCEQNYSDKIYDKICKSFVKNNVNNEGKIDSSLSKGNFRHKYHKCVQQFTLYLSFGWLWGPVKVENTVKIYKPFVPILLGSLAYELHNHACLESDDLGVLIPAKKYSTYKVVKVEKEMLSAILFKLFSDMNTLIFENDECSMLKESLVGFVKARSAPCGHLFPVRETCKLLNLKLIEWFSCPCPRQRQFHHMNHARWNSTIYHTDLGQNAVFHKFSRQIALSQYSGRSIEGF